MEKEQDKKVVKKAKSPLKKEEVMPSRLNSDIQECLDKANGVYKKASK